MADFTILIPKGKSLCFAAHYELNKGKWKKPNLLLLHNPENAAGESKM
jgi:hypothetical protein